MRTSYRGLVSRFVLFVLTLAACRAPATPEPAALASPTPPPVSASDPTPTSEPAALAPTRPAVLPASDIPAFPGAEGFGAAATGGRGGEVLYVTTLDPDPGGDLPGSLNWALRQEGPRYILFKVSGVIEGAAHIVHGDMTLAGQTSPGGIVVRGLVCDGHYDGNPCSNLIVRHIRSRPAAHINANENILDDALRLDGLKTFIVDHGSFANAADEAIQISWASQGTIQNSILGETVGEHFDRGGMLINYSHSDYPQDNLTIVRNMWYRIGGRMPELTCEPSGYPDQPAESPSLCAAQPLNIEIANNLLWDPGLPMWYNPPVDPGGDLSAGTFLVTLNYVNNYVFARPDYGQPMVLDAFINQAGNSLYFSGNKMNLYPDYADYQLVYCCNDFNLYNPNTEPGVATRRETRHDFPSIVYIPTEQLVQYMIGNVGAFPRDPMDQRYITTLITGAIDPAPLDRPAADDALRLTFESGGPAAPLDGDSDGMPDDWESTNGLDPNTADHNGTELSSKFTGLEGYTNLECYLNWLSDQRVTGTGGP